MKALSRRSFFARSGVVTLAFAGLQRFATLPAFAEGAGELDKKLETDFYGTLDLPPGSRYTLFSETGDKMDDGLLVPGKHDGTRNWLERTIRVGKKLAVEWVDIANVEAPHDDLRYQGYYERGAARFARGEGCWYGHDSVFFACTNGGAKKKGQIFRYTPSPSEGTAGEAHQLGVDRIFVDEAHYFKNLFYLTKMTRIAGLPQTASERAFDMFLKVPHVQSLNGGGGVVFATGTPIANSMAEMFTMQRYLQPDDLKKHNLHHFDSWAATFGEPVTAMELSPDGAGYRLNTRFARFINVPELMQMFRQSADVQTAAMLNLPRPKLDGERPTIRNAPATPELRAFVQELAARAERLKTNRVDPSKDKMLKITSEGRKAALDLRLTKPSTPDEPQGKVNLAVENIHRIWAASATERSAQLVFCDLSTPKDRGFSVYRDMADKLERLGVPTREIAFIQDYDSDASKLALFRDVRSGKVRVLFGSTQKMGSGTNVQERLIALHHLDAPWRPADVEQREGRILRQGNKNAVVSVLRYVTEGSFDAYMWQTLETKAKFIAQVMSGDMTIRRLEDLDSAALTYAEVKAIASGNPLVIEKA